MNTAKILKDAGSSCCLLLPLIGGAAVAGPLASADIPSELDLDASQASRYLSPTEMGESLISVGAALEPEGLAEGSKAMGIKRLSLFSPGEARVLSGTLSGQSEGLVEVVEQSALYQASSSELIEPSISADDPSEQVEAADVEALDLDLYASKAHKDDSAAFGALLVELRTGDVAGTKTLVKGAENGREAIAFDQWLIPFDDVVRALGFTAAIETDGQITLTSTEITTQIRLESLPSDPELGVMWSVSDIANKLGATAEFDRDQYAIRFNRNVLDRDRAVQVVSTYQDATHSALAASYIAEIADISIAEAPLEGAKTLPDSADSLLESATLPLDSNVTPAFELPALDRSSSLSQQVASPELGVLLVGLSVGEILTVETTLVKGREDGLEAIAFEQWLVPFDDAMMALGATITYEEDGLIALRAPGLATVLDPQELVSDLEIGQAISIATIEERLGIAAEFDREQYTIRFSPPAIAIESSFSKQAARWLRGERTYDPATTAGLPAARPAAFSLSAVSQSTRVNSSRDRLLNEPVGQLSAVGSFLGGSWYARINQPALSDYGSWQLKELQYLRPGDREDYAFGSQPTFWQARNSNQDYWGATTIRRWGFAPPDVRSTGGFIPRARLQASQILRTVSGEAAPGTFVRLTQGLNGATIDETIVNSSGLYRFEDIPVSARLDDRYFGKGYLVQLYANGQLNSPPEIQSASFTTLPGQLPQGASALIASAGTGYRTQQDRTVGTFNAFRGGIAYRYGISDALTLGAGFVQDGTAQVLTEGFYLPKNLPLQAAFSATVDIETGNAEIDANVRYQPAKNLRMTFNSDRFSQRLNANWRISPYFSLVATGNTRENTLSLEANGSYAIKRWRGGATVAADTAQNLRWRIYSSNGSFGISHQGSEVSTYSRMSYSLPKFRGNSNERSGHQLSLSYQTLQSSSSNSTPLLQLSTGDAPIAERTGRLAIAEWRYRPQRRTTYGSSRWDVAIGYAVSANRSGPLASATVSLNSGLDLQMRYQSTSILSESESLQISLVSRLNKQGGFGQSGLGRSGFGWGHRRQDELRTQGGIHLQPFFDVNANGIRDANEELYLESPELLFLIDNSYIDLEGKKSINDSGILLSLKPDTYRLDIDPAGLPVDKAPAETSYAVTVVPGQHTTVAVPLTTTYTVSGVVMDAAGAAVSGARVEAIGESGHRQQSVTNEAGVYYLERLRPEAYNFSINGVLIEDDSLLIEGNSDPLLEKEIRLL